MNLIRTIENDKLSLFLSALEERVQAARGSDQRPGLDDPMMLAATLVAEMTHAGQAVPEQAPPEVAATTGRGAAGDTLWRCARLASELALAKLGGDAARVAQLEAQFRDSTCDPRWAEAIAQYLTFFGPDGRKGAIPYRRFRALGDFVYDVLPPDARIVLLGDWGTGMAPALALLQQIAALRPHTLIHLGDIYYAGTARETQLHFLDVVRRVLGPVGTRVWAMPGNHEMYSGGAPYYDMLAQLGGPPAQEASYFSLRSTDGAWQFLAMDTGLHDHDPFEVSSGMTFLEPDEQAWQLDKLTRFGGRSVLISHHQLFSAFAGIGRTSDKPRGLEAYNTSLWNAFRAPIQAGQVTAWFWGHEHNLTIYEPYGGLGKGRCIGHGAVPVFTSQEPYKVLSDVPNPPRLVKDAAGREVKLAAKAQGIFDLGFALVTLKGATAEVAYYVSSDPQRPLYVETLS